MRLHVRPERLAVAQLPAGAPMPDWFAADRPFCALLRTEEGLTLVCAEGDVPSEVTAERGWRALTVVGSLDFSLTGIVATLAGLLADRGVPIFALSSYDTDHLLVADEHLANAADALRDAGHEVH